MKSYWLESSPFTPYPVLSDNAVADVVVIGGGIAGICCAHEIARTGRPVILLEGRRIFSGVTGHTTAKVTSAHTLAYSRISQSLGAEAASLYARSQQDALGHVRTRVDEFGIDCDLEIRPAYTYSSDVEQIQAEARAATEAGLPASFVTTTGLPFPVAAAVRVEEQAQFHPLRYLGAIADDFQRQGGQIFEDSRVVELKPGTPCRLTTETGVTIEAGTVVVATGFPILNKLSVLPRLVPRRELVVAAPVPADRDPQGMYITPEENLRSVRTAPWRDGQRLLIVTGESYRPGEPGVEERFEVLARWTSERFGVDEIAFRWSAQDNETTDGIPYVGRLDDNVYVATGFGGWGMTNGVAAGLMIADELEDNPRPWAGLFDPGRVHVKAEAGELLRNAATVTRHFIGDRVRTRTAETVTDIPPGTGAVVKVDGERVAVYRDPDGQAHAVSAVCTHQGCLVGFNEAESTWDCPCHGSRFDTHGYVVCGPAVKPLAPQPLPQEWTAESTSDA